MRVGVNLGRGGGRMERKLNDANAVQAIQEHRNKNIKSKTKC